MRGSRVTTEESESVGETEPYIQTLRVLMGILMEDEPVRMKELPNGRTTQNYESYQPH